MTIFSNPKVVANHLIRTLSKRSTTCVGKAPNRSIKSRSNNSSSASVFNEFNCVYRLKRSVMLLIKSSGNISEKPVSTVTSFTNSLVFMSSLYKFLNSVSLSSSIASLRIF